MAEHLNDLGLPIGVAITDWKTVPRPPTTAMEGRFCQLEPTDVEQHAAGLYEANRLDLEDRIWTYLPYGPFLGLPDYQDWMMRTCLGDDPKFYTIVDKASGKPVGVASYLRIMPETGVIEVGHINFSPAMQRSPVATEAMYLMMKRVFEELGYRRYEWKCDALNERSMTAARRYGFTFEGIFRQAAVYKNRNRDTAWFSILNSEWPDTKKAFETWLSPDNFDADGHQHQSLATLMVNRSEENT